MNEVFDLFAAWARRRAARLPDTSTPRARTAGRRTLDGPNDNLAPLFDLIVRHVPPPKVVRRKDEAVPDAGRCSKRPFLGRLLTGRIESGKAVPGSRSRRCRDGKEIERGRITKLLAFRGLKRVPVEEASRRATSSPSPACPRRPSPTPSAIMEVDRAAAGPADRPADHGHDLLGQRQPLAGREGDKVQSRVIRDRLLKEAEGNVAIRVTETADKDAFEVAGRGELQLGVLIETMRREGFELSISRPRVVFQTDPEPASAWSRSKKS
jgi:GTP-binding protein